MDGGDDASCAGSNVFLIGCFVCMYVVKLSLECGGFCGVGGWRLDGWCVWTDLWRVCFNIAS